MTARFARSLITVVLIAGCAAQHDAGTVAESTDRATQNESSAVQRPVSARPSKPWLKPAAGATPPTAPAAAAIVRKDGERYDAILADAWDGDSNAIGWMFGYEDQGAFSGNASREHHRVLLALLRRVGDSVYAKNLAREGLRTHREVARALLEAAGADGSDIRAANPRTFDVDSIGGRE